MTRLPMNLPRIDRLSYWFFSRQWLLSHYVLPCI